MLKLSVVFGLVIFISSIVAVNMLSNSDDEAIVALFGSFPATLWTMFKLMTLDSWIDITIPVLKARPDMLAFFMSYIFIASTALMTLIPAVFIELNLIAVTREMSKKDDVPAMSPGQKRMVKRLFRLADWGKTGLASIEDLQQALMSVQHQIRTSGSTSTDLWEVRLSLFDCWEETDGWESHAFRGLSEEQVLEALLNSRRRSAAAGPWRAQSATRMQLHELRGTLRSELRDATQELKAFISEAMAASCRCSSEVVEQESSTSL
ncbi:unnamed protein product [Polarella glacialis]|nr:unnamed protein product [Polarella glacialis]